MIRFLKKRPEGIKIFEGLCSSAVYFENHDDAGPYAYVGFEIYANKANLHMHIIRWSHTVAKNLKRDWKVHVAMLQNLGVDYIVVINQDADDKRWHKFIRLFGFLKPKLVQTARLKLIKESDHG